MCVCVYHPQSAHLNVIGHVGANGTHYIVGEEKLVRNDETFVQVFSHTNLVNE